MSANAPPPPGPEVWQAQYLRLIAFPTEPAFDHSRGWWRDLTGAEPQSSTERRLKLEREDSGPHAGVELSLAVDPLRVQWTAALPVDIANPPEGIPVIGPFLERRDWFRDLMMHWLDVMGRPIKRLALAGILIIPVDNRGAAYERLNQYLRWVEIDPNSRDFLYRINRALPNSRVVGDVAINRLMTWAAVVQIYLRQVIMPGNLDATQFVRGESLGVLLDLDINTTAERQTPLPQDRLGPLFAELIDEARDIARDGDTRP